MKRTGILFMRIALLSLVIIPVSLDAQINVKRIKSKPDIPTGIQRKFLTVPDPYPTIQSAINSAVDGDVVIVDTGTYYENIDFLGKEIIVRSRRGASATKIVGSKSTTVVLINKGEGKNTVLEGFTITGGGGVYTSPPNGTQGGGIYINRSTAGKISSPQILNNIITGNNADWGGGIYIEYCDSTLIKNNIIEKDTASIEGGGIYIHNSSPTVEGNKIYYNFAGSYGGGGRSVGAERSASPLIFDNELKYNFAGDGGGGFSHLGQGNPYLINNIIVKNTSGSIGGGVNTAPWSGIAYTTLVNNLIADNSSSAGGGIHSSGNTQINIINNTIYGNSPDGFYIYYSFGFLSIDIQNSILWGNSQRQISGYTGSLLRVNYSDIQGGWYGTGNLNIYPDFVDTANGDFHLLLSSPCINRGDNAYLPYDIYDLDGDSIYQEPIPIDLDGNPRIQDTTVDMGAYEHQGMGLSSDGFVGSSNKTSGVLGSEGDSPGYIFSLSQNMPNPFSRGKGTTIGYSIPETRYVKLSVYNSAGELVRTLVSRIQDRGTYSVVWDGEGNSGERLAGGVYFYRITAGEFSDTKKLLLLR